MTELRTLAWGLIVVGIDVRIDGFDLVPDPVGWCLAVFALQSLKPLHPYLGTAFVAAVVGLVVSVPDWFGASGWLISAVDAVAQLVLVFATCGALMALVPSRSTTANQIRWGLVGLGGLATLIGVTADASGASADDGLVVLVVPVILAALGVAIWFLVFLFQCARATPDQPRAAVT